MSRSCSATPAGVLRAPWPRRGRAVAAQGLDRYARAEARADRLDDPVEDLRVGWDRHIEFGLANPELYALIWGEHLVPARAVEARKADRILRARVHRTDAARRLSFSEADATWLVLAIGTGVTLALLASARRHGSSRRRCWPVRPY